MDEVEDDEIDEVENEILMDSTDQQMMKYQNE
jgi:hypothetical protein